MLKPAVFLDRDGVINVDSGYVYKVSDFQWIDGAKQAIKYINEKEYYVFIVTNQSGIGRGYYSESDVINLHNFIDTEIIKIGAKIDDFFYSPYHPEGIIAEYKKLSHLRKPNTGMLDLAYNRYSIDKNKSLLIGDKQTDMQCAENFGIKGYLFNSDKFNLQSFIMNII